MTLEILPLLESASSNSHLQHSVGLLPSEVLPPVNQDLTGLFLTESLRFEQKIGAGTYGLIYHIKDVVSNKSYAAKMVLKEPMPRLGTGSHLEGNKKFIEHQFYEYFTHKHTDISRVSLEEIKERGAACPFLREIALHLRVHDHPNIVTIHGVLNLGSIGVLTLMDFFEQGDLFYNIIERKVLSRPPFYQDKQKLMKNAILQLIEAVDYCSKKGIYHCDLKPENVMVKYNRLYRRKSGSEIVDHNEIQLVLIDFGLSMSTDLICCNVCRGSSFYMAPERITNYNTNEIARSLIKLDEYRASSKIGEKEVYFPTLAGDIWSVGVLCLNITCSRNPWPSAAISHSNGENDVFRHYIFKNRRVLRNILPISLEFNCVLDRIFQLSPHDRISLSNLAAEIKQCDFFFDNQRQLPTPNESDVSDEGDEDQIVDPHEYVTYSSKLTMGKCTKGYQEYSCPRHV